MNTDQSRLRLSKHFIARWRELYGADPCLRTIREILRGAVWLQKSYDLLYLSGTPYRTLSIYVDFERQIAIKVDEVNGVVVTLIWAGERRVATNVHEKTRKGLE